MTTPDIGWHYSRMEGAVTLLSVKGGVNLDHFGGAKVDQLVKG